MNEFFKIALQMLVIGLAALAFGALVLPFNSVRDPTPAHAAVRHAAAWAAWAASAAASAAAGRDRH